MQLSDAQVSAWQQFLLAHGRVVGRIDDDLTAACGMSLAEYEVLHHLADADGHRLRMHELADRARVSPSGLTRRFDVMVRRGWVERERCDIDRRGVFARLTADGMAQLEQARPIHDQGVETYFFEYLGTDDIHCLSTVMVAVVDGNAPDAQPAPPVAVAS
jgi:DNA-binding MarR family transcriptional regulator